MIAKNTESLHNPASHEKVIADLLMKNFQDPVRMLKEGKIDCSVITAGFRHVKQEKKSAGGKADYWRLDWPRYNNLSPEARKFMDPREVWYNGDRENIRGTQGLCPLQWCSRSLRRCRSKLQNERHEMV